MMVEFSSGIGASGGGVEFEEHRNLRSSDVRQFNLQ
jgi:hypothetical protein